jgi:predicted RNA binding protein YcfA (HicA-like mRNA interferase family)
VKARELIKLLERDGWLHVRTKGRHRRFQHSVKPRLITVAGKPSIDVPPGTLNSILKSAGVKQQP